MQSGTDYITLSDTCSLRRLETPCVYNKVTDELYELGQDGFEFLARCDGTATLDELGGVPEFVKYCFDEGILETIEEPHKKRLVLGRAPEPSLRYLELQLTRKCNLACRHCYLGEPDGSDINLMSVFGLFEQFDRMQGIRMLISGGEPLLHRHFWYINERLMDFGFRSVLMTNGTLVTPDVAMRLKVNEAQVSIDGLKGAHDMLRGDDTFNKAVRAVENLTEAGIKVSVATMATRFNRNDFDDMRILMESLGVSEWNVDAPSFAGRAKDNKTLMLPPDEAARCMAYGFGGGKYENGNGYACGRHLCAVGPDGRVAKCGFYMDKPVGTISEGLEACWGRIEGVPTDRLGCDCEHIDECKGGCRYRAEKAGDPLGPDPVKCCSYGLKPDSRKGGGGIDDKEGGEGLEQRV